jgi:hypothetical protein
MSNGIIGFSQIGDSESAVAFDLVDCPNTLLERQGLRVLFVHQDFLGNYGNSATVTPASLQSDADTGSTFLNAASATYGPNVDLPVLVHEHRQQRVRVVHDRTRQDRPQQRQTSSGPRRAYAVGALGDSAFFFGLTTYANATRDIVADNPSNSARRRV